ncbi:hypothetical protein NUU61_009822 [Penicillium alfredii]|uniref:Uncharacterized protein n=1 Tax=Penicillium alfredii TaxID=1506179 RepID=A0A9W9EGU4_9EURO|nr:uncharacterized protein NUU61_009822 [Penicillium alfredii]KAJ5081558.1 hypothetical protein NUU61_009822 [Penicillium alfredii]
MQAARTAPEIANILMDAGASHEAGHPVGHSPLSLALETGNLPVVKFFLETGADPNTDNGVCWEFYKAATVTQTEAARLLVDYINVDQAVQDPDDYGLLQVEAAAVDFVDLMKQLLEHCRFAPEAESSIRAFDWAIGYGHLEMVKLLLDHGADPNANADTEPPIYLAMVQGRDEIGRVLSFQRSTEPPVS